MTKRRRDDATNPGTSPGPRFPGGVVPPPAGSTMREDLATNATTTTTTTTAGGDGADGDANAALANGETNEPFMPPAKAPPLRAEDIPGLNTAERRLVLSRWNSRLRALKNRARDISYQFPTSNVMVFLSKPFPTERRHGWWCVSHETLETQSGKDESFFNEATASASARTEAKEEFLAFGPMTRVTRDYRLEENLEDVRRLSGSQILRRTVADLMGVVMREKEKAVDAIEYEGGGASEEEAEEEAEAGTPSAKTVDGLYKKLLPLVAAELHSRLAHELVQSGFVRRTGAVPGVTLMKKSQEYVESRRTEVVVEDPFRLMDPDDAPKTDEESRLVSATLRAHRLINADRVNQSRVQIGQLNHNID